MARDKKISLIISAKNQAQGAFASIKKGLGGIASMAKNLFSPTGLIMGGLAGLGLGKLAGSFIETASSFEGLEASLTTTLGSLDKAREAIKYANKEAAASPYTVLEYGEAIRTLSAYGVDYAKVMKTVGDTSAAMNKPLSQAVEALADALQGEGERLKEFGIKQKVAGDQITYTWTDTMGKVRETIAKNNPAIIQETLLGIWNEKYQGGMSKFASTWQGMTSTAKSLWDEFKLAIMDAGPFKIMKDYLAGLIEKVQELKGSGDLQVWAVQTALAVVTSFKHIIQIVAGAGEAVIAFGRALNATYGAAIKIVGGLAAIQLGESSDFLGSAKEAQAKGKNFDGRKAGPELDAYVREIEEKVESLRMTAEAAVAIVEDSEGFGDRLKDVQGRLVSNADKAVQSLDAQAKKIEEQAAAADKAKTAIEGHAKAFEENSIIVRAAADAWATSVLAAFDSEAAGIDRLIDKYRQLNEAAGRKGGTLSSGGSNLAGLERALSDAERTE
jgi:hypothetical protein